MPTRPSEPKDFISVSLEEAWPAIVFQCSTHKLRTIPLPPDHLSDHPHAIFRITWLKESSRLSINHRIRKTIESCCNHRNSTSACLDADNAESLHVPNNCNIRHNKKICPCKTFLQIGIIEFPKKMYTML